MQIYVHPLISKLAFDILGNQVWRQFCIRMRSSVSAARTQLSSFYRFNVSYMCVCTYLGMYICTYECMLPLSKIYTLGEI